jgi:hypothetical protein
MVKSLLQESQDAYFENIFDERPREEKIAIKKLMDANYIYIIPEK